jgi:uncharacterized OB-fold protein
VSDELGAGRPLPPVTPDTAGWWAATRDRRLLVQRCRACGNRQHYPRDLCLRCAGTDLELTPTSGRGSVYSFTVVHRPPHPAFVPPYVVALVRLDDGPQLLTNVVGAEPDEVRCGMAVVVAWEPLDDGRHLPVFTPA